MPGSLQHPLCTPPGFERVKEFFLYDVCFWGFAQFWGSSRGTDGSICRAKYLPGIVFGNQLLFVCWFLLCFCVRSTTVSSNFLWFRPEIFSFPSPRHLDADLQVEAVGGVLWPEAQDGFFFCIFLQPGCQGDVSDAGLGLLGRAIAVRIPPPSDSSCRSIACALMCSSQLDPISRNSPMS